MEWYWYIIYIVLGILILVGLSYYLNNIGVSPFKRIIILVAVFVLEVIFGIVIYGNGGIMPLNINYPPSPNVCPDYWQYANNLCIIPDNGRNVGSLGKVPVASGYNKTYNGIDFNNAGWSSSGKTAFCAKQSWANTNNIWWDSITNIDGGC
jgi:hypothetical protein